MATEYYMVAWVTQFVIKVVPRCDNDYHIAEYSNPQSLSVNKRFEPRKGELYFKLLYNLPTTYY